MKTIKKQLVLATLFGIAISLAPAAIGQSVTTPYLQDFNPPFPTYVSPDYLGWEGPLNNAIWLQNCVTTQWVNFDGSPVMNMRNRETVTGTPMVGERLPNWLISPDVLITDPDAIISWVEAASTNIWAGPRNSPRNLWISVGFGPWTFVDSYSSGSLPDAYKGEGWRRKTYPLGAYAGQTIRWKWEMISEEQASAPDDNKWEYSYWCIDNVYIGGGYSYLQDFNPPFPTYVSPDYLGWEGPLNNAIWLQNCVGTSWVNFDGSPVMNMRNRETVTGTPMVGERLPNWLISPDVLITDPDAIISWVEAASTNIWAGPRNSPRNLWISVGFGPWTFVDSYSSGSLPDAYKGEGWRRKTYPLGAYTGQYIRWKWEMISEEQASAPDDNKWEYSYWCIDNVYIGSSAGTVPIYTLPAGYVWFVIDENPREGTITVSNGGPHLMNLQSVAVEGSSAFSITDQPSVYPVNISGFLDASGVPNVAIKVKFQPTTSGLIDGKLVVNYNGTASSFDFSGHSAVADFNCADAIPLTDLFCSEGPPAECKKSIVGPQGLAYVYTALYDQDVTISSCDPHNTTVPFSYCYETWLKVFSGCPTDPNTILLVNNDDQETNCGYNRASSAGTFHMARNETAYIYWPLVFPYAAHAYDDFVFTITVTPTPPWPDAEFTADKTVISTGESVNFLCNSTGSPTIWAWEFPGSTQESSTLENPMGITYPLAGNYQVKLTASNAHFSGNMTKIAYIIVAEAGSEPETEQIPGGSEGFTVGGLKIGSAITSTEWTFGDNNGLGMNWQIRNTGINACSVNEPVMPSTTGYSGYLVLPAVEYNCAGGIPTNVEVDAFAQSPAFDCSGYDVIIYQFQQRFYANGQQPRMELQVSKDGGYNWKSFDLLQGRGLNTLWGNPVETAQINITEVAGRQSDVRVRFYWKGSTNYFWMIDDVEVLGIKACEGLEVSIAGDDVVYRGYDPKSSSTLIPTVLGGQGPYEYLWSTSETTPNITVRPLETTEYLLDVIDVQGCATKSSFTVQVEDVRCGNKLDKVLMCKKDNGKKSPPTAICVAPSAVPAQLKNGATLGACQQSGPGGESTILELENPEMSVYPNPNNGRVNMELKGFNEGQICIEVRDVLGRMVYREEVSKPGGQYLKSIDLDRSGIYFITVKSNFITINSQVSVIR